MLAVVSAHNEIHRLGHFTTATWAKALTAAIVGKEDLKVIKNLRSMRPPISTQRLDISNKLVNSVMSAPTINVDLANAPIHFNLCIRF